MQQPDQQVFREISMKLKRNRKGGYRFGSATRLPMPYKFNLQSHTEHHQGLSNLHHSGESNRCEVLDSLEF